jgi:site-specific recombinase XerD
MLVLRADDLNRIAAPSEFLLSLLADNSATNTIKARASDLALWWRWCVDHTANAAPAPIEPMSATAADLTAFVLRLQTTPKTHPLTTPIRVMPGDKRARSSRTIARIVDSIKQFYLWAARCQGMISDATAKQMLNFKTPRVIDVATVDRLQPPLVRRVLAIPKGIRECFLLELLYGTGIREGEALGLRIEDIHLSADDAAIVNCCFPGGAHLHVVRRRNPNGATAKSLYSRIVPLAPQAVSGYRAWMADRYDRFGDRDDSAYVFVSIKGPNAGSAWCVSSMLSWWRRTIQMQPGLEHVTPHVLRHTYTSELQDAGVAAVTVSELLGHRSPRSTQTYTHAQASTMAAAGAALLSWRQDRHLVNTG